MKKALSVSGGILLALAMLLGVTTPLVIAQTTISNETELQAINTNVTTLADDYILIADIDLTGVSFTPIGSVATPFTGSFDGQSSSYTISNLTINLSATDYVGLFGCASGSATIENVALESVNITGMNYVGGLAGLSSGTISNCHVIGRVNGADYIGGLAGRTYDISISNCYASGGVYGDGSIGGLVGYNGSGVISNCYASGGVSGSGNSVGGLVGQSASSSLISNCYATGGVTGNIDVGGLVGYHTTSTISNSYATSGVTALTGNEGGLVGDNLGSTITNCFWSGNQANGCGNGSGDVTKVADHRALFSSSHQVYAGNWDFANIWGMTDGVTYPYLGSPGVAAPVIEILTIIFVSIGLIGIICFILYRKRETAMVGS